MTNSEPKFEDLYRPASWDDGSNLKKPREEAAPLGLASKLVGLGIVASLLKFDRRIVVAAAAVGAGVAALKAAEAVPVSQH